MITAAMAWRATGVAMLALWCGCARVGFSPWPCEDQACDGHGRCGVTWSGAAQCACDLGFRNQGPLRCVRDPYQVIDPSVDAMVADGPGSERAGASDTANPDSAPGADHAATDAAMRDAAIPDATATDTATTDTATPDNALPDNALPDNALPDNALPDNALPDNALPDNALPDLATTDAESNDASLQNTAFCSDLPCIVAALADPGIAILRIQSGTYALYMTLEVSHAMHILGEDWVSSGRPLLMGNDNLLQLVHVTADDVTLEGLEIRVNAGGAIANDLIRTDAPAVARLTLRDLVLGDSGDDCVDLNYCTDCLIERCVAMDCAEDAFNLDESPRGVVRDSQAIRSGSTNAAIFFYNAAGGVIEGNLVTGCTSEIGIQMSWCGDGRIVDNLVAGNSFVHTGIALQGETGRPELAHNTVVGNTMASTAMPHHGHALRIDESTSEVFAAVRDNVVVGATRCAVYVRALAAVTVSGTVHHNGFWQAPGGDVCGDAVGFDQHDNLVVDPLFEGVASDPCWGLTWTLGPESPLRGTASDGEDPGVRYARCRQ